MINAVTTLRRAGKGYGGGGFEAPILQDSKRPDKIRQEVTMQGLTGVSAYDGKTGWKISPWEGKKDVEPLEEEELKSMIEDSDFDGPLVNHQKKGITITYAGLEPVDGTDAYKLKLVFPNGDVQYYFLDTDYFVPIKIEIHRMVRGAERVYEVALSDYKQVAGWYIPFSIETNAQGSQSKWKVAYDTIEANIPMDDSRFTKPAVPTHD